MPSRSFPIERVREVYQDISNWLGPVATRMEIVGSVRRERPTVRDLDLLIIPRRDRDPLRRLLLMSYQESIHLTPQEHEGHFHFVHCASGVPVDLFLARDLDDWWGKLVVFTGSKAWLAKVRALAHRNVLAFHDDGRIEITKGRFRRPRSERDVFRYLGIAHIPPGART